MGKILSKFRKEKTTIEVLEGLDDTIKKLEAFSVTTQARQKRLIGNFLVISIGLYVLAFLVFYFMFFPPTWNERIVYSTPMLLFPVIIILVKYVVAWYFGRKMNKNLSQLQSLKAEKKRILEQVQEKETYKVALEILNKFSERPIPRPAETPRVPEMRTPLQTPQIRQRILSPQTADGQPLMRQIQSPQLVGSLNRSFQTSRAPVTPRARQTPFPIVDQRDKGVLEKMVDYLIGDGPSNRFAMICRECHGHNGMALQEESEYTSFRCAFCDYLNMAKKQRPVAPKLERTPERNVSDSTSDEELNSGSDKESGDENLGTKDDAPEPKEQQDANAEEKKMA